MSTGDSTLMMLLSLNLLLLVFFVLLNSMATEGAKHEKHPLAQVAHGSLTPTQEVTAGESLEGGGGSPAWRASVMNRLQGVVLNRLDLKVLPQESNADTLEADIPLAVVFGVDGRLAKPEILRNLQAAAGSESALRWQIRGKDLSSERRAQLLGALAIETAHAEAVATGDNVLRLIVTPGLATKADTGLQVQQVGEEAGGTVQGVAKGVNGE